VRQTFSPPRKISVWINCKRWTYCEKKKSRVRQNADTKGNDRVEGSGVGVLGCGSITPPRSSPGARRLTGGRTEKSFWHAGQIKRFSHVTRCRLTKTMGCRVSTDCPSATASETESESRPQPVTSTTVPPRRSLTASATKGGRGRGCRRQG
jgi:hypothetical protein